MTTSHPWAFRAGFRRRAFGWSGTRKAIERMSEAVAEIERMARTDPALADEGAVLLLEKLSPAVSDIDSSSGALGNAAAGGVATLAPLIAATPVPQRVREKWMARLFDAVQEDDPPYIASLGEYWCASARCMSGGCLTPWASVRRSPNAGPSSATIWRCWSGSARHDLRSQKVRHRAPADRLHR